MHSIVISGNQHIHITTTYEQINIGRGRALK